MPLLDFIFSSKESSAARVDKMTVGTRQIPLVLVRHPRARRYLLRLRADGAARVTIPRGGSVVAAREFVQRNARWLEQQVQRWEARPRQSSRWTVGSEILFRGELTRITAGDAGAIFFGGGQLKVTDANADLRKVLEHHLRELATVELPGRLRELAARHGLAVRRVMVRNQRTRWGSCSRNRTISLNWRLIQTPDFVQDYIHLHELAHLIEMNHSARFWREVERLCPDYEVAERWLKLNRNLLR